MRQCLCIKREKNTEQWGTVRWQWGTATLNPCVARDLPCVCVCACVREQLDCVTPPPPHASCTRELIKIQWAVNLFHTRLPRPPTDGRTEEKKPKKKEGKKIAETHGCRSCWLPQEVRAAGEETTERDLLFNSNNPIVC
jgi:hypothetical protein